MKSAGKARNNGLYRHIRTSKEIIRNLLNDSDEEYRRVLQSLIRLKNSLIAQGRYTDAVDDILCKVLSAKKRKFKIKYI